MSHQNEEELDLKDMHLLEQTAGNTDRLDSVPKIDEQVDIPEISSTTFDKDTSQIEGDVTPDQSQTGDKLESGIQNMATKMFEDNPQQQKDVPAEQTKEEDSPIAEDVQLSTEEKPKNDIEPMEMEAPAMEEDKAQEEDVGLKEDHLGPNSSTSSENNSIEEGMMVEDTVPPLVFAAFTIRRYSEEELEDAMLAFEKSRNPPSQEIAPELIHYISNKRARAIEEADYDEGDRYNSLIFSLKIELAADLVRSELERDANITEMRLESAERELKELQIIWKEKCRQIQNEQADKERQIRMRQEDETAMFTERWETGQTLCEYSKPSSLLITLRQKEKRQALTGDFAGAKETKKRADKLEKEETLQAQQAAVEGMKKNYAQMRARHQKELDVNDLFTQKLLNEANLKMNQAIHPVEMAIKKLQNKRAEGPQPRRAFIKTQQVENHQTVADTPRTVKRFSDFRASGTTRHLDLRGIKMRDAIPKSDRKPLRTQSQMAMRKKPEEDDF